ncbi:MAG: GtrA family protein [Anaerovoracaceae bacterium]|nr:GtrA family protein [Anaerovoracaceae bacterium]
MIRKISRLANTEAFRYLIIGGLTTLLSFGTYVMFCSGFGWSVTAANVTSIVISILFAYAANKAFVFRSVCGSVSGAALEFGKFISGRLFTMLLEVGGVFLFYNILGWDKVPAKVLTQAAVIVLNFIISKFFVFTDVRKGVNDAQRA